MADTHPILEALTAHLDAQLELSLFVQSHADLAFSASELGAGFQPPAWLFPMERLVGRMNDTSEALEVLLRTKVIPALEPLQ